MKPLRHVYSLVPDCHAQTGHFGRLWRRHFYDGLRPVVEKLTIPEDVDFEWVSAARGADTEGPHPQRTEASEKIFRQIQRVHSGEGIDAVISYCFSADIHPDLVRRVVALGIPWVNFFCDSTHCFEKIEPLAQLVSLNWFVEHAAIPSYRALGTPHLCQPYALNPGFLPDCRNSGAGRPAVFIGSPTANRITQLGLLRCHGCEVEVRGHLPIEPRGVREVIRVHDGDEFARTTRQPGDQPAAVEQVFLLWEDFQARVAAGAPQRGHGAVGRGVVHEDQFQVRARLGENAGRRGFEESSRVVGHHQHGNQGRHRSRGTLSRTRPDASPRGFARLPRRETVV